MKSRMPIRWFLVPTWLVAGIPAFYLLLAIFDGMRTLMAGGPLPAGLHILGCYVAIGAMLAVGSARCALLYPGANPGYAAWLAQTPWKPGRSLPLGPSHLWWQDLLLLAIVGAMVVADLWRFKEHDMVMLLFPEGSFPSLIVVFVVGAFAIAFVVRAVQSLVAIRHWVEPVLIAIIAPLLFWSFTRPLPLLGVVVCLLLIANIGILRSLKQFPWSPPGALVPSFIWLGWPLNRLSPVKMPQLPRGLGLGVALLLGWWIFSFAEFTQRLHSARTDRLDYVDVGEFGFLIGAGLALARTVLYCHAYHWPLGPVARLFTGRAIIPGYDYVFLAPAATLGVGLLVPGWCERAGLAPTLAQGVTLAAIVAVVTELGPSYRNWRLTGLHRISTWTFTNDRRSITAKLSADMKRLARAGR